ncbi:MAG: hypothetical protein GY856_27250 [bacterium]|nr:hypothetical protein [bacterium]
MSWKIRAIAVCLYVLTAGYGDQAWAQFGELPPDAVSHSEMDRSSELVLWLMFDPTLVQDQVPEGLRLLTLEELAARVPEIADHLKSHPQHRGWAHSVFEVIGTEGMRIDGRSAEFGPRGGLALWYAYAARTDDKDPRPRGGQTLNLETWISDHRLAASLREKGYSWKPATVELWPDDQGTMHGRLQAAGIEVVGTCRLEGAPEELQVDDSPSYLTFWNPRSEAGCFEIVTSYGHREQRCAAEWKVAGEHLLARAFRERAEGNDRISGTYYERDFFVLGGLYGRQ